MGKFVMNFATTVAVSVAAIYTVRYIDRKIQEHHHG